MPRPPVDLVPADVPAESLTHNTLNGVTGGIWRTRRDGRPAVLKLLAPPGRPGPTHWAGSDDPGHWNYWRREVEAYRSGLATSAYPGLAGPAALAVDEAGRHRPARRGDVRPARRGGDHGRPPSPAGAAGTLGRRSA